MSSTTSGQASFASPVRVQSAELSTVAEWLSAGEQVFALLDACGEPLIPAKVVELDSRACSLFRGAAERDYTHIAPYVAHVDQELAQWIIERLGDTPWGYFVRTQPCTLADIRKHFRKD